MYAIYYMHQGNSGPGAAARAPEATVVLFLNEESAKEWVEQETGKMRGQLFYFVDSISAVREGFMVKYPLGMENLSVTFSYVTPCSENLQLDETA